MIRKLLLIGIVIIALAAWGTSEWMDYLQREQAKLPNQMNVSQGISLPAPPTAKDLQNLAANIQASQPIDPAAAAKLAQPQLSRAYFFCEKEIQRLAKDWPTQAGNRFSTAGVDVANSIRTNRYSGRWAVGPLPASEKQPALVLHSLTLSVVLQHPNPEMVCFELLGHYEPVDRWGVEWRMTFDKGLTQAKLESWQAIPPRGSKGPAATGASPSANVVKWEQYIHPNEYSESRHIELHWAHLPRSVLYSDRDKMDHIRRFWKSPTDFQAAALAELEKFDKFVADWDARGAIVSIGEYPLDGGNPPLDRSAPAEFRAAVLAHAAQHTQTRRDLLNEHAEELHRAMHESFPAMLQLLDELQRPAHLP